MPLPFSINPVFFGIECLSRTKKVYSNTNYSFFPKALHCFSCFCMSVELIQRVECFLIRWQISAIHSFHSNPPERDVKVFTDRNGIIVFSLSCNVSPLTTEVTFCVIQMTWLTFVSFVAFICATVDQGRKRFKIVHMLSTVGRGLKYKS